MINNLLDNDKNIKDKLFKLSFREIRLEAKKLSIHLYSRKTKKELVELHGEETWEKLNKFYSVIQELFKGTRLRGIILTAEKPMGW